METVHLLILIAGPALFGLFTSIFVLTFALKELQQGRSSKWKSVVPAAIGVISSASVFGVAKLIMPFAQVDQGNPQMPVYTLCMLSSSLFGVGLGGIWSTYPFLRSLWRGWAFYSTFSDLYEELGTELVDVFVMRTSINAEPGFWERIWIRLHGMLRIKGRKDEKTLRGERLAKRKRKLASKLKLSPERFQRRLTEATEIYSNYLRKKADSDGI
jgi:hypothetical protein